MTLPPKAQIELFDSHRRLTVNPWLMTLSILAVGLLMLGAWMAFFYAPGEKVMGFVQKIFYFHVPAAWSMMLSAPVLAVGSITYLITRRDLWDRIADAGVELAILFGIMVIISGPLWARKAWGVFWVWDVRLTSTLVMVLTLVACKIVRSYSGPQSKTISAGLSILALLNAVFVWYAVDLWSGSHPPKLVQKLEPRMFATLWVCVGGFTLTYIALLWSRLRIGSLETAVERIHMKVTEAGLDN
ncbi:MAG: cytochrome c biogenesis protein CcsA [Myxococcales bacterium]|nr:cytochrome c biogenesis protein CcsA [Myxococcales bacterium]